MSIIYLHDKQTYPKRLYRKNGKLYVKHNQEYKRVKSTIYNDQIVYVEK